MQLHHVTPHAIRLATHILLLPDTPPTTHYVCIRGVCAGDPPARREGRRTCVAAGLTPRRARQSHHTTPPPHRRTPSACSPPAAPPPPMPVLALLGGRTPWRAAHARRRRRATGNHATAGALRHATTCTPRWGTPRHLRPPPHAATRHHLYTVAGRAGVVRLPRSRALLRALECRGVGWPVSLRHAPRLTAGSLFPHCSRIAL